MTEDERALLLLTARAISTLMSKSDVFRQVDVEFLYQAIRKVEPTYLDKPVPGYPKALKK